MSQYPTFAQLAAFQLRHKKQKDKNIVIKIEAITAATMIDNEAMRNALLKEAYDRFKKYEMDVDDLPPHDHIDFMSKVKAIIDA